MRVLKQFFFLLLFTILSVVSFAQQDSVAKPETTKAIVKRDTSIPVRKVVRQQVDSVKRSALPVLTKKQDSTLYRDSLALLNRKADSLRRDSLQGASSQKSVAAAPKIDTSTYAAIMPIAQLPFFGKPVFKINNEHKGENKDQLFYVLVGVTAFLGFIKVVFPRYFRNLFIIFFQTSFRQKQTRDQLVQDTWASLFMNLMFVISVSIYAVLILLQKGKVHMGFWEILLYCSVILILVYTGKFLFLRFWGWVFNVKEAADTYIFVVFLTNKIMGVLLIPFLLVLAFSGGQFAEIAGTVSIFVLGGMLIYRYLVSLGTIRNTLKVSGLHFFLYLCAIEVLPLLIMYKAVFNYIETSI
ncbi:DUF4271 domain-containing protein [Chitinophagaceae bacterium LWZ2-11]